MLGVIRDRRIGGGAVRSTLIVYGEAGQVAVGPSFSAVGRRGKADVGAPPTDGARAARDMESTDNDRTPRECGGLNFRLMHAIRVGEGVGADWLQRVLSANG